MICGMRRTRAWRRVASPLTILLVSSIALLFVWHAGNVFVSQDAATELTAEQSRLKPPHLHNTHAFEKRQVLFKPPFVYRSRASPTVGKPFNVSLDIVQSLHLIPESFTIRTAANADDVVFVTAASGDHFIESMNLVASVQRFKPGHLIIYYDLGLYQTQINEVKSWCSVELRKFGNPAYPKHVTERLKTYAFKLLIIQEVLREFPGMFWMDASIRLTGSDLSAAYAKAVKTNGFVIMNNGSNTIFTETYPGLYDYMPSNIERLKKTWVRASGFMLIYNTFETFNNYLLWMYLCGLDRKCAAPHSSINCVYDKNKDKATTWANCHRYDQSVVNVLAVNRWNFDNDAYHARRVPFTVIRLKWMWFSVAPTRCNQTSRRK